MTREENEERERALFAAEPYDEDTKLERMIKIWNRTPEVERRKVTRLLAGEITTRAVAETPGEPSEEYGAFQAAHWLLWAALPRREEP